MTKSFFSRSGLAVLCALAAAQTQAATTLTGINGKVNIGETLLNSNTLGYLVDTIGSTSVEAFAVSNNSVNWAQVGGFARTFWGYTIVDQTQWDAGVSIPGRDGNFAFSTNQLGSYSSFFGTDRFAALYVVNGSGAVAINDTNDQDTVDWGTASPQFGIRKITSSASEFIALDSSYHIIDQSLGSSVPEPAALSLLALTLPLVTRRRRA